MLFRSYQYATDVQEVRRYLKGVTGEDISLENLYPVSYTHLGGRSPERAHANDAGADVFSPKDAVIRDVYKRQHLHRQRLIRKSDK